MAVHKPDENAKPEEITTATGEVTEVLEDVGEFSTRITKNLFVDTLAYLGEIVSLIGQSVGSLRRGLHLGDFMQQMATIGVDSIPIAILTAGFSSAVFALYTAKTLSEFGAPDLVGGVVAISVLRETAPILTAVAVAARSGSAMTAEIGSMKVTEQIDALRSMAISPVEYLVTPRFLASIIALPLVCIFSMFAGVLFGMLVAQYYGVPGSLYLSSIRTLLNPDGSDLWKGLSKTIVFGAIIAAVGCREGLESSGGATGVGQATTRSVVIAIVLLFLANLLLSFALFGGKS